jgi:hypothetical protein
LFLNSSGCFNICTVAAAQYHKGVEEKAYWPSAQSSAV